MDARPSVSSVALAHRVMQMASKPSPNQTPYNTENGLERQAPIPRMAITDYKEPENRLEL